MSFVAGAEPSALPWSCGPPLNRSLQLRGIEPGPICLYQPPSWNCRSALLLSTGLWFPVVLQQRLLFLVSSVCPCPAEEEEVDKMMEQKMREEQERRRKKEMEERMSLEETKEQVGEAPSLPKASGPPAHSHVLCSSPSDLEAAGETFGPAGGEAPTFPTAEEGAPRRRETSSQGTKVGGIEKGGGKEP